MLGRIYGYEYTRKTTWKSLKGLEILLRGTPVRRLGELAPAIDDAGLEPPGDAGWTPPGVTR